MSQIGPHCPQSPAILHFCQVSPIYPITVTLSLCCPIPIPCFGEAILFLLRYTLYLPHNRLIWYRCSYFFPISCILILYLLHRIRVHGKKNEVMGCGGRMCIVWGYRILLRNMSIVCLSDWAVLPTDPSNILQLWTEFYLLDHNGFEPVCSMPCFGYAIPFLLR